MTDSGYHISRLEGIRAHAELAPSEGLGSERGSASGRRAANHLRRAAQILDAPIPERERCLNHLLGTDRSGQLLGTQAASEPPRSAGDGLPIGQAGESQA